MISQGQPAARDAAEPSESASRAEALLFGAGDYVAAGLMGMATAVAVRFVVAPGFDLALAMLLGIAAGTFVHVAIGFLLSPFIGFFHAMVPGGLIGMYGGMLFAMRDAMQPVSLRHAVTVGAVFGAIIMAIVQFYDYALAGGRQSGAP